jgi:hypothetical protein
MFVAQFREDSKAMEAADITVGSRIYVVAGKASNMLYLNFGGIVRQVGYDLGPDDKILYTLIGSSYGIRLNERVLYVDSEATKTTLGDFNMSDATRKADTLLENTVGPLLNSEGLISLSGLASRSDVETFIASSTVEYGEVQDFVNLIEESSGGTVVITPIVGGTSIMDLKHEPAIGAYGYTIKNKHPSVSGAKDDADDTMYMLGKARSFLKQFDKSSNYANRCYGILATEDEPDIDATNLGSQGTYNAWNVEVAQKFKPTHTHYIPGDIYIAAHPITDVDDGLSRVRPLVRICSDAGGVPTNSNGILANLYYASPEATGNNTFEDAGWGISNEIASWYGPGLSTNNNLFIDLDTTQYYWLILTMELGNKGNSAWTGTPSVTYAVESNSTGLLAWANSPKSTHTNGGSGWTLGTGTMWMRMPRRRSHSIAIWDPKAIYAVSSGLSQGLYTDNVLHDAPNYIRTREQLIRYLVNQLYEQSKPRTQFETPIVSAPNVPVFPGDVIVINDSVMGHTQPGGQVMITTCGDMTYSWGVRGGPGLEYTGATKLAIQPVGMLSGYS